VHNLLNLIQEYALTRTGLRSCRKSDTVRLRSSSVHESGVVVKINPNILLCERQWYKAKKYSSVISERTEENNCPDCLQPKTNVAENFMCE